MFKLRLCVALGLVLPLLLGAGRAWAWGDTAHIAICEIAFQELEPASRAEVIRLIGQDDRFRLFHEACTWADHPRKRAQEHYVNIPRAFGAFSGTACPLADICLLTAIPDDLQVLRVAGSDREKVEALAFLGHWVGDLHQPLHVSFADDRGGNRIRATGTCGRSLHSAWDSCMVEAVLGTDGAAAGGILAGEITDAERQAWTASAPLSWANESLDIVRRATTLYCVPDAATCRYDQDNESYTAGMTEKVVAVDRAYIAIHAPTVRLRLKQAGVRLGRLINAALGEPR